ncbi:MAG: ABC-F family ATP-binding cassette domain-containing protein [Candidatus Yanofskybacteria bacterium]|nr:ABC-F family ATP-binding cassette domain-containing protein [Candidatus Yanofskybacteria bacterium]
MTQGEVILRFDEVQFSYGLAKPILQDADFVMRRRAKLALMGQNGAGKSTIFNLIAGILEPESGDIHRASKITIATAKQVIPRDQLSLTVREFFEACFPHKVYNIDPKIDQVLEVVHLVAPKERRIDSFSGGQQARLLLASALIQNPDVLLLDEPTNNLDKEGIAHLTKFLVDYENTCIVISHDSGFLNAFTTGVLYLDVFTKKVEQYAGNYFDLVKEITARIERENRKNAQLAKRIQENKDKANFFGNKGGSMRLVAKRMRQRAETLEEEKVVVRREDKTIRPFTIPAQEGIGGELLRISSFTAMRGEKAVSQTANISLRKNEHLLITGPNGIGKSTLIEALAAGTAKGSTISPAVKVGCYTQDFSTLNLNDTVYDSLSSVARDSTEQEIRSTAAGFLLTSDFIHSPISSLSEGQKGLVSLARLVLQRPGLLILDEPTNHINFRHLPVIASALNAYQGAMVLVSHVPEFVSQIRIDTVLDMEK